MLTWTEIIIPFALVHAEARTQGPMLDRQAVTTELSPHSHTSIFKLYFEVGEWDSCTLIRAVFLVEFKKNVQLLTFVVLLDQDSNV